ncbi:MAG: PASTA domain-containing protein [Cyclobacteriaceae bacterium]
MLQKIIKIVKHLSIMIGIVAFSIIFFFYIYLPTITNHGESITVPDLQGVAFDQLHDYLTLRNLRYEILPDSGFSTEYQPNAVLKQFPLANSKVKENRKIYLTLNSTKPPMVKMPNLVDGSVKNAIVVLKSKGLTLGKIRYVPDPFRFAVKEQHYEGDEIIEDELIPKGASIDLVVGDGLGRQDYEMQNFIGMDYEDVEFAIVGFGLQLGNVRFEKEAFGTEIEVTDEGDTTYNTFQYAPGVIFRQYPRPENKIRIGESVDLWVVEPIEEDSLAVESEISDLD